MRTLTTTLSFIATTMGLAGAAASAMAAATTAHDGSDTKSYETVVHVGDLDLNSQSGADHAYGRVHRAARFVCGEDANPVFVEARRALHRCAQETIADAVADVNLPALTAAYDERHPNRPLQTSRRTHLGRETIRIVVG
jgi:UrcA family protein